MLPGYLRAGPRPAKWALDVTLECEKLEAENFEVYIASPATEGTFINLVGQQDKPRYAELEPKGGKHEARSGQEELPGGFCCKNRRGTAKGLCGPWVREC